MPSEISLLMSCERWEDKVDEDKNLKLLWEYGEKACSL